MEQTNIKKEELENKEKDILEEIEEIMIEELRFYSDKGKTIVGKQQRLLITDRMCKSANVVLATENLKERRYMNRTDRKDLIRKTENKK